jgi:hypothetical protein
MPTSKSRRPVLAGGVVALIAAAGVPAGASAADLPTAPVGDAQVTVTTPSGWVVEDHGPKNEKQDRLTQLVVRRPDGTVDALLYPEAQSDFCDPKAKSYHCLPLRAIFTTPPKMGTDGLVVTDNDGDGIPEIAIGMFSRGAHCCITDVGYWRDAAGAWKSDITNGGSLGGDHTDAAGRLEISAPAFEGMDWSFAATQPFYTWSLLVPGKGWVDVTTRKEHEAEITDMTRAIKKFSKYRDASEAIQAARAVRIGHRKALGQTTKLRAERKVYRAKYGRSAARSLDRVLARIPVVK